MAPYLVALRGTLQAGTVGEIFSHSIAVESAAEPSALAAAVATAWEAEWAGPNGAIAHHFPPGVVYTEVTAAPIIELAPPTKLFVAWHQPFATGLAGTSLAGSIPTQNAIAVSLTAGQRANGQYYKGRFYLPSPARDAIDTASGLLTTVAQTEIQNSMVAFVDNLHNTGHDVSVWSRMSMGAPSGLLSPIQLLRVGNRVDTIRRRRNSSAETYLQSPVLP